MMCLLLPIANNTLQLKTKTSCTILLHSASQAKWDKTPFLCYYFYVDLKLLIYCLLKCWVIDAPSYQSCKIRQTGLSFQHNLKNINFKRYAKRCKLRCLDQSFKNCCQLRPVIAYICMMFILQTCFQNYMAPTKCNQCQHRWCVWVFKSDF